MACEAASLGREWAVILGGRTTRKTNHESSKTISQGEGFSWGMSLRVVGRHLSLA